MNNSLAVGNNYYTNLQLEDLPNEVWVDALGYDGMYEVSNLGRIKSLRREVNTRWGTPRMSEEIIMKQCIIKAENGRVDGLIIALLHKTTRSSSLIFKSFYPEIDFGKNECVMHINKNVLDNRLENLEKATRIISKNVDMVKSVRTILATPLNIKKAQETNKAFYDSRTHKQCSECGKVDVLDNFPDNVSRCQRCINNYVIERRKNFTYKGGKRKCNECGNDKNDDEFHKLENTCKECRYESHKKYQDEQREKLGDWYVKEYGKYTYGIKEFDQKIIDKLRAELIEKRKPKHHFDSKEFATTRDFAKYVFDKYKVPITTVEKRISEGRTEYECTLNRKAFVRFNLKKKENKDN